MLFGISACISGVFAADKPLKQATTERHTRIMEVPPEVFAEQLLPMLSSDISNKELAQLRLTSEEWVKMVSRFIVTEHLRTGNAINFSQRGKWLG